MVNTETRVPGIVYNMSPVEYGGLLRTIAVNNIARVRFDFTGFNIPEGNCLVVVGSDGKGEAHSRSKPEIAIWGKDNVISSAQIFQWFEEIYHEPCCDNYEMWPDGEMDVRNINDPVALAYTRGRLYPDRVVNTRFLLGDENTYREALLSTYSLMGEDNELGYKIRRELRAQLNSYKDTFESGIFNKTRVLDNEQMAQYYDGERMTGFKTPVLRYVQRALDMIEARSILKGTTNVEQMLEKPTFTPDRIAFLISIGVILPEMAGLSEAYLWYLQQYHLAQELHENAHHAVIKEPFDQTIHFYFLRYFDKLNQILRKGNS